VFFAVEHCNVKIADELVALADILEPQAHIGLRVAFGLKVIAHNDMLGIHKNFNDQLFPDSDNVVFDRVFDE
jgi:hypothetical protein